MKKLILALSLMYSTNSYCQINLDSLYQVWMDENQEDSIRFQAMEAVIWDGYMYTQPDTARELTNQLIEFAQERENLKWESIALNTKGGSSLLLGDDLNALMCYSEKLKIDRDLNDNNRIAHALNSIGQVYQNQGNNAKALDYFTEGLELFESIDNKEGIALCLDNIGGIYSDEGKIEKAFEFFNRSLNLRNEIGDNFGKASSLNNIGILFDSQGKTSEALYYFTSSANLFEEMGNNYGLASMLNNLGNLHRYLRNHDEALINCTRSLKLFEEIGEKNGMSASLGIMADVYIDQGKFDLAAKAGERSLSIAKETGNIENIRVAAKIISRLYEEQGEGLQALEMYKLQALMSDSLNTLDASSQIAKAESKAEFEKALLIKEQEQKEADRIKAERISRRNSIQYSGIGFGVLALFGLVFLIGRIQLPDWAIELSVFLPFLILFEFLLVITDPFVDAFSGGEPLIKLLINALLAGLIFPLHSFFEKLLKKRLFSTT